MGAMTATIAAVRSRPPSKAGKPDRWGKWTPWTIAPFQRRFLDDTVPGKYRIIGLSVARGAGKTWLAGLVGAEELVERGGEIYLVASSFQQARIGFEDILAALKYRWPDEEAFSERFRVNDYGNRALIEDRVSGGRVQGIGADPDRAMGLRPSLVIADECASWKVASERLWAGARTALGKVPGGRIVTMGTRPPYRSHWYQKVLDTVDPEVRIHVYQGDDDTDQVFSWRQVHKANPGLKNGWPERGQLEMEMRLAKSDPAAAMAWRALRLNLGEPEGGYGTLLVPHAVWREARALPLPEPQGDYVLGLDVGGKRSLTSAAAYWPGNGRLDSFSLCGGNPGLAERGREDNVGGLYEQAAAQGELLVDEGKRYPDPAVLLRYALGEWGMPYVMVSDQYRRAEVEDLAAAFGVPVDFVHAGSRQGAEVIGRTKRAFGEGLIRPVPRLLLDYAVSKARSRTTFAGDEVLDLRTKPGALQDDPAAAAFLAVAVGRRLAEEQAEGQVVVL